MVEVVCQCGTMLSLPDQYAGKRGKCPACGAVVNIPAAPPPVEDEFAPPPVQHVAAAPEPAMPQPTVFQSPAPQPAAAYRESVSAPAGTVREPQRSPRTPVPVLPPSVSPSISPRAVTPPPVAMQAGASAAGPATTDLLERLDPRLWPLGAKLGAGGVAIVLVLLIGFSLGRGGNSTSPQRDSATDSAVANQPATSGETAPSSVNPPSPRPKPAETAQPTQVAVNSSPASQTTGNGQVGTFQEKPVQAPRPTPPRTPPKTIGKPGDLTGGSREYDDLHCQRLQAQHAVRVPATATMLEVDGERLPLANLPQLAESPTPLLFLPRGTHAVRFRQGEQAVIVKIDSDLSQVYQEMRRYFDVSGTVHDKELFSRGARAMDVHRAPFLLNLMGATHLSAEQWEAAERKFRRSLRVNPLFAPAHLNLAVALEHRKAHAEAVREVELADACNVGNAFGLSAGVAEVRRKLGLPVGIRTTSDVEFVSYVYNESLSEEDVRITALLKGMSKYAVREEDRGKILNNLAVHFADTGRTELALDHFRGALAVIKTAGPERFALAKQVMSHMSDACRKAGFDEAAEYQAMQGLVSP